MEARRIEVLESCRRLRLRLREDDLPAEVAPGLFIGALGAANNRRALLAAGITHVVSACAEAAPTFPAEVAHLHVRIRDERGAPIGEHFAETFAFIESALEQGGAVLVHCVMGRSRSACLVAAYLMRKERVSLLCALEQIRAARPCIAPIPSFAVQLLRLERSLGVAPLAGKAGPAADTPAAGGDPPSLSWLGALRLVLSVTPVLLSPLAALPTLALLPPLPGLEQVARAVERGRLPLRQMACALLATAFAALAASRLLRGRPRQRSQA